MTIHSFYLMLQWWLVTIGHCAYQHSQCHCFHSSVCCVFAGSSTEFATEADGTDVTEPKLYLCTVCDKWFARKNTLNRHRRIHVPSSGGPYHCPYCGKLFDTENDLKRHIDIHIGAKPYSCEHCSERFTWPGQLKTHLLKSHNEGNWFVHNICGYKYTLYMHIISVS